ncbi:response regulator [Maridesulfovibrio sp.]|uniref:response regulator n=1 Tax=Maridesulfovibrio sp. TaxID=2795000 RepID=UPI002A18C5AE|nr:response regulator [Maridesulfovibrio sp.]
MFDFLRIKAKAIVGLLLIQAVILIALGILITAYRSNEVSDSQLARGEGIAALVATSSGDPIVKFQNHKIRELVKSACSTEHIFFCAVYTPKGEIFSEYYTADKSDYPEDKTVFVQKRIIRDGEYLGYVRVGVLKNADTENRGFFLKIMLPALAAAFVFGGLAMIFFLGKSILNPVIKLSRQAQDIAEEKYTESGDNGRKDEIGELARSLNTLATKFSQLQNDLDQQVRNRTEELNISNRKLSDEILEHGEIEAHLKTTLEQLSFSMKQLEKAREKAEKSSRFKSEFLAMISHEIRTPMNAILGMGELLQETELDAEQLGYVEIFRGSGEILLKIINDILDFVQIESGLIELVPVPFNPSEDMQSVCKSMAHSAHAKDIEIICDVDRSVPHQVMGDPVRVRQILMNIIANAIKYTSSGEVAIRLTLEESANDYDRLLYTVRDTGAGIPDGIQGNIFDSFVQADSTTAREYGGIGLGLAAASRLADLMDGEIRFESARGKGTVFYFSIPFKKSSYETAGNVADFSDVKVLLVDDNRTVREVMGRRLLTFGIEASMAADGNEGLEFLKASSSGKEEYDMIFIDSEMPDMSGIEFLKRAQQEKIISGLSAIMFSAGCSEEERRNAREAGADQTLIKPVFDADILRCLQAADEREKPIKDKPGTGMKILLVEDNEDHSRILELFIAETGAETIIASDGLQAVQLFADNDFDLVFMDLGLPLVNGVEAVSRIRELEQQESKKPAAIVALAAHAFGEHKEDCRQAGCDGFISKPVRWDTIRATIAALADGYGLPAKITLTE